jgi:hypothetical protein
MRTVDEALMTQLAVDHHLLVTLDARICEVRRSQRCAFNVL